MQAHILRSISIDHQLHSRYLSHPQEIDVVISVGGFYGLFAIGTDKILKKLEKNRQLTIRRYAGSSVGAICAVCMACHISGDRIVNVYNRLSHTPHYFKALRKELLSLLPEDAYLKCTDKVFIHMTKVGFPYLLEHVVVSRFIHNEDLVDAMMASSNMPFLVSSSLVYRFRGGYYVDGCFSRFLPVFEDHVHAQLLLKLYHIQYYGPFSFIPKDPSIEGLIVKGAVETDKFFSEPNPEIKTLTWYHPTSISYPTIRFMVSYFCSSTSLGLILGYLWFHPKS